MAKVARVEGNSSPVCPKCGSVETWVDCDACGGSCFTGHDCGEDTCCCLDPVYNVLCDICRGEGGWFACLQCADPAWVNELIEDGRL